MGNWRKVRENDIEKLRLSGFENDSRILYGSKPSTDIPARLLQNSIKVASESAREIKANFVHALALLNDDTMEQWQKDQEFKEFLYHSCIFHAIIDFK
jgi:hypothetical protein